MLDTFDLVKYVAACADNAQVGVKWMNEGEAPRCDGKNIYVPRPKSNMTHDEVVLFKRAVAHETSHVKYSDFSILNQVKLEGLEKLIMNCVEDYRIDTLNDGKYAGDSSVTEEHMAMMGTRFSSKKDELSDMFKDKGAPLMAWDLSNRDYMMSKDYLSEEMESLSSDTGKEIRDKLKKFDSVLKNLATIEDKFDGTYESVRLAKQIAEEVFEETVSPMPSKQDLKEGKGDPNKGGEGKEKGKGRSSAKGGDKELETGGGAYPDHDENGTVNQEEGPKEGGGEGHGEGPYTPDPEPQVVDMTKPTTSIHAEFTRHINEGISNRVRTLLQVATRKRTVYGQKKGKLNTGSLHRIPIDVKGYSDRVFKHKVVNNALDTAVTLLVDCSGSMSGQKIRHAASAAAMMNHVMNNVLKVNTEVLGFTEHRKTAMYIMKKFDGPKQAPESLASKFANVDLDNNVDGESIMFAYNRIKNRKEKRKIIFVLSDGIPCGGYDKGNINQYTKDVIRFVEHSNVELYAIGIHHDCSKLYTHSTKIDDPSTLEQHLLEVLKNTLIG